MNNQSMPPPPPRPTYPSARPLDFQNTRDLDAGDYADTYAENYSGGAKLTGVFTGHAPTVIVSKPEQIDVPASVTVAITGVEAKGEAGKLLYAETGKYVITGGEVKMSVEKARALQADLEAIQAEMEAERNGFNPRDAYPFPVDDVPLFDGPRNAVAWLPDAEARKVSLKRITDDSLDLQEAYWEGRSVLVAWRRLCLWGFLAKMFCLTLLMPVINVLAKTPAWLWAFALWLFDWKKS